MSLTGHCDVIARTLRADMVWGTFMTIWGPNRTGARLQLNQRKLQLEVKRRFVSMSRQIRSAFCTGLVLFFVFVCTLNVQAHGQEFDFGTINFPGAAGTSAYGINASGKIVGSYGDSNSSNGFLYSGGRFTTISFPGWAGYTWAFGINASGKIVGYYEDGTGFHGFLDSGGRFTAINFPGAFATVALGINAGGKIVGYYCYSTPAGSDCRGFLYSGGNYTTIAFPGGFTTYAYGINASGQIVGVYSVPNHGDHGFLYSDGSYTTIDVPGAFTTYAYGINTSGQIVGYYQEYGSGGSYGFLYSEGQFSNIDYPGGDVAETYGINDAEGIVGNAEPAETAFFACPSPACPRKETTSFDSWGDGEWVTAGLWNATLLPNSGNYDGLRVQETNGNPGGGGSGMDTCWWPASMVDKFDQISGGQWTVSQGNPTVCNRTADPVGDNEYGQDCVGWSDGAVDYYRTNHRAPCGTSFLQVMQFLDPDTGAWVTYGGTNTGNPNTLGAKIRMSTVSSIRAGQEVTKTYITH
jgi:probable HAF family extracellular repeat protein